MGNKLRSAEWFGFNEDDASIVQYLLMKEENFTVKDIGISYTELNYWDKKELLHIVRESENGWRKFNFFDIVWLGIVRDLRAFGISTTLIKEYKESAFSLIELTELKELAWQVLESIPADEESENARAIEKAKNVLRLESIEKGDSLTRFEYWLLHAIVEGQTASLLFFISGEAAYWNNDDELHNSVELRQQRVSEPHTVISLNTIMCDLIEENLIVPYLPYLNVTTVQEGELLNMINHGMYESITITFKDNRPDFVLATKASSSDKRKLSEVLLEGGYQTIRIKQHRGEVTLIENEKKIPFKDLGKE